MSEFKITGPGEYRTRDGHKVEILEKTSHSKWPWCGIFAGRIPTEAWSSNGRFYDDASDSKHDIIGPWVEPAVETEPDACPDPNLIYPVKLRDWFAGMALQGLLAHAADRFAKDGNLIACAFSIADEMMAARQKGGAV